MVNPRKSRDGKYTQNLENGKYWEIRTLIKKIYYGFFCVFVSLERIFLNFTGFIILLHPLRFAIK